MKLRQAIKIQNQKHRDCYNPDQLRRSDAKCWQSGWRAWYLHAPRVAESASHFTEAMTGMALSLREVALQLRLPKRLVDGNPDYGSYNGRNQ